MDIFTVLVQYFKSKNGHYKFTKDEAKQECETHGLNVATREQLKKANGQGLDVCACGWLADGSAAYPITKPRSGCAKNPGLQDCSSNPADWNQSGWDVYCHP